MPLAKAPDRIFPLVVAEPARSVVLYFSPDVMPLFQWMVSTVLETAFFVREEQFSAFLDVLEVVPGELLVIPGTELPVHDERCTVTVMVWMAAFELSPGEIVADPLSVHERLGGGPLAAHATPGAKSTPTLSAMTATTPQRLRQAFSSHTTPYGAPCTGATSPGGAAPRRSQGGPFAQCLIALRESIGKGRTGPTRVPPGGSKGPGQRLEKLVVGVGGVFADRPGLDVPGFNSQSSHAIGSGRAYTRAFPGGSER